MPGTDVIVLSRAERFERRRNNVYEACEGFGWCIAVLIPVATIIGTMVGVTYWLEMENTAANEPVDAFEVKRVCDVLTVSHRYNASDQSCADVFTYTWKRADSPVVYIEEESKDREEEECLLDLDISEMNATFQNGTNDCFVVTDQYLNYVPHFSCAPVFALNNGSVGKCTTLLPPKSNYDNSVAETLGVIFFVLFVICLCACFN